MRRRHPNRLFDTHRTDVSRETPHAEGVRSGEGARRERAVSRETRRPWFGIAALAIVGAFALTTTVACGVPPGPQGWAGPVPVKIASQNIILVSHKKTLFAMPAGSSNALWQFPPKDKNSYPVSEESQQTIGSAIDALDIDQATKQQLHQKLADLRISGPTAGELKDAVEATGASSDAKSNLKNGIDNVVSFEKTALNDVQAIYGNLGLTSDDSTVFVPGFSGYLYALDSKTGFTKWIRDTGAEMVGGVAVDGDTIYWGNKDNKVAAWKADSAEQVWTFETNGEVWATPTVDGSDLYVTSLDGSAYKLDRGSGKQVWHFDGAKSGIAARPVVDGTTVYIGSFDSNMYALDTDHGTVDWSFKGGNWFWATPLVKDGVVYAACLDGKMYAIDATSGAQKWAYDTGSPLRAMPVFVGDDIVVASRNGDIGMLAQASGDAVEGSPVATGTGIYADLAKGDGTTVYISPTSNSLLEFDARAPLGLPGSTQLPQ